MLPDQGQRGCKVTHPSTHLDKNQNTHLKNFFHWTIHYPNIFLLYCLAIPKYWWYIISKNGISSSSYNSVSHWSCACFYFYFIWFLLMINFQHPTVTEVVGWAGSLKGYCFLNGEPHAPSNYIYCLLTAAPHLIKGISWRKKLEIFGNFLRAVFVIFGEQIKNKKFPSHLHIFSDYFSRSTRQNLYFRCPLQIFIISF